MIEDRVIEHCAPTLAGIKSANLFNYFYTDKAEVIEELAKVNALLNQKGVYADALLWRNDSVLIFIYRKTMLEKELQNSEAAALLIKYGYEGCDVEGCLAHLQERLSRYTCFPHEIGIFLGYPIEDVKGFIENQGKNCESCGFWKVYCNATEKEKLFCKMRKCTQYYIRNFQEGRSLLQMTVCVQ